MKLWEVLKELEENPEKRFKSFNRTLGIENVLELSESHLYLKRTNLHGEELPSDTDSGGFNGNINIHADWQEVKQPVTWQEAIEAWANGKAVKCECEGGVTFFKPPRQSSACFTDKLITHGTWYIED